MDHFIAKPNLQLLTPLKRSDYRYYLNHPQEKNQHPNLAIRRRAATNKFYALKHFELQDNQVSKATYILMHLINVLRYIGVLNILKMVLYYQLDMQHAHMMPLILYVDRIKTSTMLVLQRPTNEFKRIIMASLNAKFDGLLISVPFVKLKLLIRANPLLSQFVLAAVLIEVKFLIEYKAYWRCLLINYSSN
jgi:hypothetical protein